MQAKKKRDADAAEALKLKLLGEAEPEARPTVAAAEEVSVDLLASKDPDVMF